MPDKPECEKWFFVKDMREAFLRHKEKGDFVATVAIKHQSNLFV